MRWIPYGPHAVLLKFADTPGDEAFARSRAIAAVLERHPPVGLIEYVPAFTTVLLEFNSAVPDNLPELLEQLQIDTPPERPMREIRVTYNGPDLQRVADTNNLSIEEVIALHAAPIYKIYMLGFSPGFPYLGDLDPRLYTPRLATPRPRVAAGSVAIGGSHTGIYSIESPGGWNIIGFTEAKLFNPSAAEMFLLSPGDRVKFVPT
jgi:inhibitor of KinA